MMIRRNKRTRAPDNANDIWILGAGFSRQICNGMPLMSDLAESVQDIITERFDNPLIIKDVELALSELRSEAPWKSPADKHADLALYELVVERIRDQLQIPCGVGKDDQGDATLGKRLVNIWHMNRNHVLTFNYDLLVEAYAASIRCQRYRDDDDVKNAYWIDPRHIYPIPIPHEQTRNGDMWRGRTGADTFRYYKLHGSLNYYTYPEPFRNTTMYHRRHTEMECMAEGLRTFIVPPTNDKQAFIEHPVLQAIWTKAVEELANNDRGRIIMVGYSLPQTDLTVLSMLRSAIRSNYEDGVALPVIIVVNPDPDAARHIKKLLGVPNPIGQVTDVTGFMEQYAPLEFVRPHVWDNRHVEYTRRILQLNDKFGSIPSEDQRYHYEELRKEFEESGRLGWEWFLSREEFLNWWQLVHQRAPVNCWI